MHSPACRCELLHPLVRDSEEIGEITDTERTVGIQRCADRVERGVPRLFLDLVSTFSQGSGALYGLLEVGMRQTDLLDQLDAYVVCDVEDQGDRLTDVRTSRRQRAPMAVCTRNVGTADEPPVVVISLEYDPIGGLGCHLLSHRSPRRFVGELLLPSYYIAYVLDSTMSNR